MKRILLTWLSVATFAASMQGQTFTNLNFESAQVVISTNFGAVQLIEATNALPGWSFVSGTNELAMVPYNNFATPAPVGLVGSNSAVIDGNFSVALWGGDESISQTGLVPAGAESLLFDATSSSFIVSLGSQSLSYTAISNALNSSGLSYTIFGADISSFAGQTETLTFSAGNAAYGILDDIQFSSIPVPEPWAISFLCLGSGVLFYVRKRRRF